MAAMTSDENRQKSIKKLFLNAMLLIIKFLNSGRLDLKDIKFFRSKNLMSFYWRR